jgi:hypothetical protein
MARVSQILRHPLSLLAALLGFGCGTASATTFLEFQSTCLGSGSFQYSMKVMKDPYITEAGFYGLYLPFTNLVDQSTSSTNWSCDGTNGAPPWVSWSSDGDPVIPPCTNTFLAQSSESSYRLANVTNCDGTPTGDGAVVTLGLTVNALFPGNSFVGYAWMPCLVPCSPDQADNSPTNFVFDLVLVSDIQINGLIQTNGVVCGVDFTYNYQSTLLLQATTDLINWTNVAYIWTTPPETIWTTNVSLGNYGQFFRLELVAGEYTTNLPPLSSAVTLAPGTAAKADATTTTAKVTNVHFVQGKVMVTVAAQPGQTLQVQAADSQGTLRQTQQTTVQGTSATVGFDAASLPNLVYFRVAPIQ